MWQKNWKVISPAVIASLASMAALMEYRRIAVLDDRLGCALFYLEKAKSVHQTQMAAPDQFSGDGMPNYLDSVEGAYVCVTRGAIAGNGPDAGRAFGQYGALPMK